MFLSVCRVCLLLLFLAGGPGVHQSAYAMAAERPNEHGTLAPDTAVVRECKVASVHDGDSMRARCSGFSKTIRIRLDQIDAPELDQATGVASRDYLRSLCRVGQDVIIHDRGLDIYSRHLGRLFCGGVDVSAAMVRTGMAWVYERYADDDSLYALQDQARRHKRGLWVGNKPPIAPWTYRYRQKQTRKIRQGN